MKPSVMVLAAVAALLVAQAFGSATFYVQAASTLIVPDDYPSINAAVENAHQGDTIQVRAGVYYENLYVDKALVIAGEDTQTVVVGEGGVERGGNSVFTLAANDITLTGFTIQSQNYTQSTNYATAIKVAGDNCTITGNSIEGIYYGVFCSVQLFTTITDNNITTALKDGVRICGGSHNTITNNNITNSAKSGIAIDGYLDTITGNSLAGNQRGIGLGASYSVVFGNNITSHSESGIYLGASDCIIAANAIADNMLGVHFTSYFAAPNNNTFYHNNFENNTYHVDVTSTHNVQVWDNGAEGNYWSGYDGTGNGGYTVYEGNIDYHPLSKPFSLNQNAAPPALPFTAETTDGASALWHFDEVSPNGATPDALGNNAVVLESSGGDVFTPVLVEGKNGNALRFNGTDYAYVTASPTLNIHGEFTIDAWVNVKEFKNVAYSNIVVECLRTPEKFPMRIFGFAFNGEPPIDNSSPPLGALRGFMLDEEGVFNEVVTTQPVIVLDEWFHVVFVRSLTLGMQIYVDGVEQEVQVLSGVQNPSGEVARGTEFYIGHDSVSVVDEVSLSSIAVVPESIQGFSLIELVLGAAVIAGLVLCGSLWVFHKREMV
ncbi:MAG: right-handed parallel beta-helix repeat-containing protein [Candidatus Bathyarchaeota archaeon]|nr:right-handed parallel beta-helix repeat-containing protein [Candidatus Bathyarchaeota archaeon]